MRGLFSSARILAIASILCAAGCGGSGSDLASTGSTTTPPTIKLTSGSNVGLPRGGNGGYGSDGDSELESAGHQHAVHHCHHLRTGHHQLSDDRSHPGGHRFVRIPRHQHRRTQQLHPGGASPGNGPFGQYPGGVHAVRGWLQLWSGASTPISRSAPRPLRTRKCAGDRRWRCEALPRPRTIACRMPSSTTPRTRLRASVRMESSVSGPFWPTAAQTAPPRRTPSIFHALRTAADVPIPGLPRARRYPIRSPLSPPTITA